MVYVLLFIIGIIIGALIVPFIIYFRARRSGWDDSNIFNVFRVICHLALHPADFIRMQYEDGKKPFWYLTKDELSEVVDGRPNKEEYCNKKEYALYVLLGYLEGIEAQIQGQLIALRKELEDGE